MSMRKKEGMRRTVAHLHSAQCTNAVIIVACAVVCLLLNQVASPRHVDARIKAIEQVADLHRAFQNPPDDSKVMMRWWWLGPAVSKPEIEREMRLMKEAGIGGFEVQPVYPVALDDASNGIKTLPFLSDDFIDALRFTNARAREIGLRFDLTLGSGWPYGGPTVPIDQAAGRLRVERVNIPEGSRRAPLPSIGAGEKLLAVFAAQAIDKSIIAGTLREITDIRDGAAILPEGTSAPLQVQFFIAGRTGMQVKRPAVGAEGFVLDHLSREAVDNYLHRVGDRLMSAFDAGPPRAVFCDSLEVYNSDWSNDFLEEFQKRRGYDLKPQLPALVNDLGRQSAAVRHDWGQTLTELLNERFLQPLQEWSRKHRALFRVQCYGTPPATLSSNRYADLSEGEGHRWKSLSATRWASSANHLFGRPVTSSETWTWLHSPSFRATPLDIKAEADRHFLQGVNQLIGHGWPYTAPGVEYPGWRFYAAGVFNDKNPWWIVMPDVSKYLQRVSYLLRQGEPTNDIAIYLPNDDAWASLANGNVNLIDALRLRLGPDLIPAVLESGYGFDFIDGDVLKQLGRIEKGSLRLASNNYRIVILPNVEQIPAETLKILAAFAQTGGTLIATRRAPVLSPGFQTKPADHQQISEMSNALFDGPTAKGRLVKDESGELARVLAAALKPDVALAPAVADIGFIHRSTSDAEIYFIANTGNERRRARATFRVEGMNPEWWDPMNGEARPATVAGRGTGGVSIDIDLEAYDSRVLVFSRGTIPAIALVTAPAPVPIDLSQGWQVSFGETGSPVKMDTLRSWTDDERTRYYSGLAFYEKSFVIPDSFLKNGIRARLDFGESKPLHVAENPRVPAMQALLEGPVREAAVVTLNGRRAGSVWCPPYSIDVTDYLKSGANKLRLIVANTAINYMAGHALPDYRLLNLRYGERFQPQDMDKVQPQPSGLLGKIRLIAGKPE